MIIVEGPDGSGKTTLVQELSTKVGLPVSPRVVSKDTQAMVDLKRWVERNVSEGFQHMIFDRHRLISEPIYGAVMRDQFEPGFDDMMWLYLRYYQLFTRCRPVLIYCIPPYGVVRSNIQNDNDNQVVRNKIRKLYALYVARAAQDAVNYGALLYDYTRPESLQPVMTEIHRVLRRVNV